MSTPAIPTPETQTDPKFDGAKFIEQRQATPGQPKPRAQAAEPPNVQEAAPVIDLEEEEEPPAPKAGESPEQAQARNRRERRANQSERIAQLERDLAYERGLREGATKVTPKEPVAAAAATSTELKREDFKTEAEFIRAVAAEEAEKRFTTRTKEQEAVDVIRAEIDAAREAFPEHVKLIPEWDKVDEKLKTLHFKGIPDANGVEQYSFFYQLWARSPYRAFVSEYFAEHPEEFTSIRDQEADRRDVAGMSQRFYRLEGRMEGVYNQRKAAQAPDPEKGKKEPQRTDPENAEQARAAASDDGKETIRLPKPSSEVSARGGSAHSNGDVSVKDNPAAWIMQRQEAEKGHR